ncbi:uncharacterized protein C2845_PM05G10910 [Panicum miliaceum]|uniref:Uncharacterized protein n=1 Tax=Panicum miliaceum TaxID=4540 RepID=A0A3L6SUI7_PANMI|nr:uncharacterized protein C2845_PM05G10910 [Panicum miliaceum]
MPASRANAEKDNSIETDAMQMQILEKIRRVYTCKLLKFRSIKYPAAGAPIPGKDVVICKFPSDPTLALGSLSLVALVVAAIVGHVAIFFRLVSALAIAMLLWATVTEGLHRSNTIHHDMNYQCPTAKTGLFGGAAFLALDAALFWLVCQMLALNARADYLYEDDNKGEYGQVYAAEVDASKV